MKGKLGKPRLYSKALGDRICKRLSEGRSLRSVCADKDVPVGPSTVCGWVLDDERFAEQYARASNLKAEALFESLVDVADAAEKALAPDVAGLRLRADILKWVVAKMLPHKYSDKVQVEQSGSQTVRVVVEYADPDDPPSPQ